MTKFEGTFSWEAPQRCPFMWQWDSIVQTNLFSMIPTTLCDLVWYSVHPKATPPMTIYDIPPQINATLKGKAAISFLKHGNCIVI